MQNTSFVLLAALTLAAACAADTDRDHAPFDPKRGLTLDIPPPPEGEDEALPRRDDGLRISRGLTLEEAETIALEANPNMTVVAEAVNAAKANIWQQSLLTNPVLGLTSDGIPMQGARQTPYAGASGPSLAYTPFNGGLFSDPQNGVVNDRPRAWDPRYSKLSFNVQKDFDVSGKRVARVDAAIESERQSEAQYGSAARQLKAQVRGAYAAVLVAEKNLELAQESFDMARKNLDILGTGALGGKVLEGDSATARAQADRARIDHTQAENALKAAKIVLVALLGNPKAVLGPLRGALPLEALPADPDPAAVARDAIDGNADVVAAKRAVLAAEANVKLQRRAMFPDVTLAAQVNMDYLDMASPQLDQTYSLTLSLSVPVPIFDQNRAQIAQAVAQLHQAQAQESAAELAVDQGVRADLTVIATSRARIEAFEKEILPGTRKAVKLTEASFEGGKVLYLSVIAARQVFNQQRQDYATELLNYETAMADLERLLGRSPAEARAR